MKKTLLQEVKAMNKIAGTQMTKEQEIALIRERLQQLNELEFGTQDAFDAYQKKHDLRGSTEVSVAGKVMTVKKAKEQSNDPTVKGTSVFGNDTTKTKKQNIFGKMFGKLMGKDTDYEEPEYPEGHPYKGLAYADGPRKGMQIQADLGMEKDHPLRKMKVLDYGRGATVGVDKIFAHPKQYMSGLSNLQKMKDEYDKDPEAFMAHVKKFPKDYYGLATARKMQKDN
jgi:hypothetical protein